jgi:4-methyl-5(b-hydroxyethyl)-thiazole monophosphate biosynthesis
MNKKVIVLMAEGFEEVETVTPITYLRRAGIEVTIAAAGESLAVKGARGVQINADILLETANAGDWDAVVVPGGLKGAENLAASEKAGALLKEMNSAGKLVCSICASPAVVLAPLGLLADRKFTCYPDFEKKVTECAAASGSKWSQERVVEDGNLITSRAAGTAGEFAIAVIEHLLGKDTAKKIAEQVLL